MGYVVSELLRCLLHFVGLGQIPCKPKELGNIVRSLP